MRWYTLYVNSRAEKKVAERLQQKGWEVFCPLQTQIRQWSDRKKKVKVPYFSSYVFVKAIESERSEILKTSGVVAFVYWLQKPAVIRDEEMKEVQAFFDTYQEEEIQTECFEIGQRLRVKEGALSDKTGIVLKQDKHRVSLRLEQIGLEASVALPKSHVEKN